MIKPIRMLALASLLAVAVVHPAQAETGDLPCTGNFQFDFTPPLTPTNTTRLNSGVRTGTDTATRHFGDRCAPVMTITERAVLTWNTGEKSEFDITVNTDPAAGRITISARFTHGLSQLTSEALQVF